MRCHAPRWTRNSAPGRGATTCLTRVHHDRAKTSNFYKDKEEVKTQAEANIEWLLGRIEEETAKVVNEKRHYFDYWCKYDGNDQLQPTQTLGEIPTPWCMVFELMDDTEEEKATNDSGILSRLSYECVEICQRCWVRTPETVVASVVLQ